MDFGARHFREAQRAAGVVAMHVGKQYRPDVFRPETRLLDMAGNRVDRTRQAGARVDHDGRAVTAFHQIDVAVGSGGQTESAPHATTDEMDRAG